ncbi:MAG: hypothetical protein HGA85_07795 [Nanoarchaeota archaeon]|nr:hypothetical protein [Nanoarchaeota archaeon]
MAATKLESKRAAKEKARSVLNRVLSEKGISPEQYADLERLEHGINWIKILIAAVSFGMLLLITWFIAIYK